MSTLNEYQLEAGKTNKGTRMFVMDDDGSLREVKGLYNVLAVNGEAGELAEKLKKEARDGVADPIAARTGKGLELGDILWYVSQGAKDLGYTLQDIADMNLAKLRSREARGVLGGSGDHR